MGIHILEGRGEGAKAPFENIAGMYSEFVFVCFSWSEAFGNSEENSVMNNMPKIKGKILFSAASLMFLNIQE